MKSAYKIKKWLTLEDAAKRLSTVLGEELSTRDVLQLALDQEITLSWYVVNRTAERVEIRHDAPQYLFKHDNLYDFIQKECPSDEEIEDFTNRYYTVVPGIENLEGIYALDINTGKELKKHILNIVLGINQTLNPYEGIFVLGDNDQLFRVTVPSSEDVRFSSYFPKREELVIRKHDLDALIEEQKTELEKPLSERERNSYLNIIGALLGILIGKTKTGNQYSRLTSQKHLIDTIHAEYGQLRGLSKRNLEAKFSEAKQETEIFLEEI
ncbi:MAG: hypothetical protein GY804_01915 [Alphaproteobacteria bacterium]|nr:hypothetical protein [Alphaproteobacteria bacterium]